MKTHTILVVDDELGARESLRVILEDDYNVLTAENAFEAQKLIDQNNDISLMLLDICMPEKDGITFLEEIRAKGNDIKVIMVTATKTLTTAVKAMKMGALDYITKPFDIEDIQAVVSESVLDSGKQISSYSDDAVFSRKNVIGYDSSLKNVFKLVDKLVKTDSTVLILGESGAGKEGIAKAIHYDSPRKSKGTFIPVHLSAVAENLIESELFGHVKGAFTGADRDRQGAFEAAGEGTIFLDEIGEISPDIQVKLLRVIQEREFRPVGSMKIVKSKARVVAATNRDLYQMVQEGKFRADLYYRLSVVPVTIPPLRDRKEDLPALIEFLAKKISLRLGQKEIYLEDSITDIFQRYSWPGNIRELENTLEKMILLSDADTLSVKDIPENICLDKEVIQTNDAPVNDDTKEGRLASLERETIQLALLRNNGVLTSTAKYLGTTRRILKYKMDKMGIDKAELFQNQN